MQTAHVVMAHIFGLVQVGVATNLTMTQTLNMLMEVVLAAVEQVVVAVRNLLGTALITTRVFDLVIVLHRFGVTMSSLLQLTMHSLLQIASNFFFVETIVNRLRDRRGWKFRNLLGATIALLYMEKIFSMMQYTA
mmetsp:Transcript_19560/g.23772  ORF Transcript_19560/g.23772 Transcript_19560/m.23772 type:complete len:135 (-) Transcript_19560:444-848(-)